MSVIENPFVTEKAMMLMEDNKLQFLVDTRANKHQIKKELEEMYGFTVNKVHTMTTMKGTKKAVVKFEGEDAAHEIATRIGLV